VPRATNNRYVLRPSKAGHETRKHAARRTSHVARRTWYDRTSVLTRVRLLALIVVTTGTVAALPAQTPTLPPAADQAIRHITAEELRGHVEALASDEMAGRVVGHRGNERAVQYVAQAFRRAGTAPAADTYFQAVELYRTALGSDSRLTIGEGLKTLALPGQSSPRSSDPGDSQMPLVDTTPGTSFYPLPESSDATVSGPLVFAGHGISARALRHDDYSRRNVRGAIVLVHDDAPDELRRRSGATDGERLQLATLDRKIADAQAHGAIGVIVIRNHTLDVQMVWVPPSSPRAATYRPHAKVRSTPMAVAVISERAAEPVLRALHAKSPLAATLRPGVVIQPVTAHNVIAMLEPARGSEEIVVVGAHLDHDGVDESGRIYNGADDNASGTAAVLAMAAALTKASGTGPRPRRRIIFALWNAEEKGSLGSEAFAAAPRPTGRIIANINLDMIGRGENANVVHMLGYSHSPDFAALARRANEPIGLTIKEEYDRDAQGLLQRSDNWPFLKRAIPALFFTTGLHPDYHTPDDDVEKIDFAKLERITELVSRLAWLVADGEPPRFRTMKKE
jgi:hypothetical protein